MALSKPALATYIHERYKKKSLEIIVIFFYERIKGIVLILFHLPVLYPLHMLRPVHNLCAFVALTYKILCEHSTL